MPAPPSPGGRAGEPLAVPPGAEHLAGLSFSLVGPGRVGASLAAWAVARGARLVRVAARRPGPAVRLAQRLAADEPTPVTLDELTSADCDLLLLTVGDGALPAVAERLARRPQAAVALHTAGGLGASVLAPLAADAGSATGSFHPLKAFPRPLEEAEELAHAAGTFFALDGAPAAIALGERLAAAFGGTSGVVPEPLRDLYHLAATVAAGGVATLVVAAAELAGGLGLEPGLREAIGRGYRGLAGSALRSLDAAAEEGRDPASAITGPLARGDRATFLRELETLAAAASPAAGGRLELVGRLGVETVRLTAGEDAAGELSDELRERGLLPG